MTKEDNNNAVRLLASLKTDIEWIKARLNKMDKSFVSKEEFSPIKKVVYGIVGIILVAVIGGFLSLIIVRPVLASFL